MSGHTAIIEPSRTLGWVASSRSKPYLEQLRDAMGLLALNPRTLLVGQSVAYDGQRMHETYDAFPAERRVEMPVAEDFQLGYCTGLALKGFIPVCVFPRIDFLLVAANQLVNHLDKLPIMGDFSPKLIIRTSVGSKYPFSAGPQHTANHSGALQQMCSTVRVVELTPEKDIVTEYQEALESEFSTVLVEHMGSY